MNGYPYTSLPPIRAENLRRHGILFLITVLTTMMIGALLTEGINFSAILDNPLLLITVGWKYAFGVLSILTAHEMGHYIAARIHGINVSLPYYIPVPLPDFFHFGTMGAFIRIRTPIPNRKVLMDIAVAGPVAGFIVSLLFLIYGYATLPELDDIIKHVELSHPYDPNADGQRPGYSILFYLFNDVWSSGLLLMIEIYHFPFIFSGWIGLFITALNLIPIGQLDGGHIVYSLFGAKARYVNYGAFALLILLTIWIGFERGLNALIWVPWIIILLLIGIVHPPTMNNSVPLDKSRKLWGWICIFIFILCLTPIPFLI